MPGGRTFGALGSHNFRLFIGGQVVSQTGTWMQRTAQAWLVLDLTNSAVALGLVTALQTLPITVLSLFAGVIADRVPKRKYLIIIMCLELVQAVVMAVLTITGVIRVEEVYLLAFLLGILTALEAPVRQSFVTETVPRDQMQGAVAVSSSSFNVARILGPGIAGVVIAVWGTGFCFALNAASFFASLAGLLLMRADLLYTSRRSQRGAVLTQLRDGLRYAWATPALLFPLVLLAFIGTFGMNFTVTLPLLARFTLSSGAVGFGGMDAAIGVGSLVGSIFFAASLPPTRRVIVLSAGGFSMLFLALAFSQSYVLSLGILMVLGVVAMIYLPITNTMLQTQSREDYRGRVLGLYQFLNQGTTPLGGALTGWLADRSGTTLTLAIEAGLCLAAVIGAQAYLYLTRSDKAPSVRS